MSPKTLYLVCVLVAFSTANGLAASMPDELWGEYTSGVTELCGYMKLDAHGYRTEEDQSCKVLKIRRLSGSPGESSLFAAEFICQIDDQKKVVEIGFLEFKKLRDIWVLAMQLSVKQKRASDLSLQIFAKCEGR
jgi:hypothetical protein